MQEVAESTHDCQWQYLEKQIITNKDVRTNNVLRVWFEVLYIPINLWLNSNMSFLSDNSIYEWRSSIKQTTNLNEMIMNWAFFVRSLI